MTNSLLAVVGTRKERRPHLLRWIKFNIVGGIGVFVQLVALVILHSCLKLNYLLATGVAVEAAVIHNFFVHERFTWADRPPVGPFQSLVRLAKFNVCNGAVSLAGNFLVMRLLVGELLIDYTAANAIEIVIFAMVNFLLSDGLVFKPDIKTGVRN